MNALEVVLVLIGVGAYAASFVLPEKDMVITYLSNNGSGEVTEAMEKYILQ